MITINQEKASQLSRLRFKENRAKEVSSIVVTTSSGRPFDGDEVSQGRMARAIIGLQGAEEGKTLLWVLHDNTSVEVNIKELQEALSLAGQRQAELWTEE